MTRTVDMPAGWLGRRRAFLFDLDGTLVDSSAAHAAAYRDALDALAPELLARFDYEPIKGMSTPRSFEQLGVRDPALLAALVARKRVRYLERAAAGEVSAFHGAAALLGLLRNHGRRRFIVTSASRPGATALLQRTGLGALVEGVVAAEDVMVSKPDPAPFLVALQRIGLPAEACLVIEDAESGVTAARSAGLDVVVVNGTGVDDVPGFASLDDLAARLLVELA